MDNLCKILIVDDEYLLRQGIKHLVDWKKEGFEIVGEASNGKEALDLIETLKPHIIICDIVMPVMDGIALVNAVKNTYPDIQIIILSGYSDFDYVKEAFKLGINDYILKPKLNPEEVIKLLKNIVSKIPNLELLTDGSNTLNINNELSKLISGFNISLTSSEASEFFPNESFMLMGSNIKNLAEKNSISVLSLKTYLRKAVKNYLKDFVFYEIDIYKDIYLIIINFQKESYPEIIRNIENMITYVSSRYSDIYFALGEVFNSIGLLQDNYNQSLKPIFLYKFFFKDKKLLSYEDLPEDNYKVKFDFKYYSDQIYMLNIPAAIDYLKRYISNCIKTCSLNELELKTLFQNALYNIINILEELNFNVEAMNNSKIEYFQMIDETASTSELLLLLENIEQEIIRLLYNNSIPKSDKIMNRILQYISNHYKEQISLKEIADEFHFNYYYLSSYFGSHIPEGFSEYLNKIRVEKALELLRNIDIPVSEISFMVGYTDPSYFSKVFKKFTKTTPSKFRRNITSGTRGYYE